MLLFVCYSLSFSHQHRRASRPTSSQPSGKWRRTAGASGVSDICTVLLSPLLPSIFHLSGVGGLWEACILLLCGQTAFCLCTEPIVHASAGRMGRCTCRGRCAVWAPSQPYGEEASASPSSSGWNCRLVDMVIGTQTTGYPISYPGHSSSSAKGTILPSRGRVA